MNRLWKRWQVKKSIASSAISIENIEIPKYHTIFIKH